MSSLCTTRKLVIYNNKTVLPLFFLAVLQFALLLVLLVHFLHMFTHTHTHTRAELFVCTVCVCECKLETETGLLVQMRALFFLVCFFCSKQPAVVPLTPPPPLAQSSCFCYALVTVRKLQLLLWLRVGGNDQQMTNFILCHLMMTTSTHKIQQEQGGREREGDQTSFSRSKFLAVTPQLPCCCSRCVVVVGFIAFYVLCWK